MLVAAGTESVMTEWVADGAVIKTLGVSEDCDTINNLRVRGKTLDKLRADFLGKLLKVK